MASSNGKASTVKTTFSRETSVSIIIEAPSEAIWEIITNVGNYPKWNSTIVSIEGEIVENGKIKLVSTLDPKRSFKLRVKEFSPTSRLVWGDGQGNRIYTLTEKDGTTIFTMTEKIGGLMFPLYAKYIPPFDESFEQFASDLKKIAEN